METKRKAGRPVGTTTRKHPMHTPQGKLTRMYRKWQGMIRRCTSPKSHNWKDYGGRGIKVCLRWTGPNGFVNFLHDMGEPPSPKHTIDRKRNHLNYTPKNCVWATLIEQQAHTRKTVRITWKGERWNIAEWARRLGIRADVMRSRLKRWPRARVFASKANS